MSLLKNLVTEMAAAGTTGANSVASVPSSLFNGGAVSLKNKKKKGIMITRLSGLGKPRLSESLGINTDETKFNAADVVSKLDAAEKKAKNTEDTVTFGMEDEDGNIVKVYVQADQAKEFEHALASLLDGGDDNDDNQNTALEIAEVLFELKSKFNIIDVDWGVIESDEEEEQEVPQEGDPNAMGADGEMPPEEGMEDDMNAGGMDQNADATSALQQVIDLLKSQAEAQKAEADAKTAEAKAKEAEYTAIASRAKIKQEEQVMDMEAYYKKQADAKKEAKTLAKLARYKHDVASDAGDMLDGGQPQVDVETTRDVSVSPGEEEEEQMVSPSRLAELIFGQIRGR